MVCPRKCLRNGGLQKLCVNICVEEEWFELKLTGYFFVE